MTDTTLTQTVQSEENLTLTLLAMHVITAAIITGVLTRSPRAA